MRKFNQLICALIGLLMLWLNSGCAQGFSISGEVSGLEDGTKISLVPFAMHDEKAVSETTFKDGRFSFTGSVPEPRQFYLVVGDRQGYYRIMVENSPITVKAEVKKRQSAPDGPVRYEWSNVTVAGSKSNDYLYSQLAAREELNKLYAANNERFSGLHSLIVKAKNQTTKDSIAALPEYKEMEKVDTEFFAAVERKYNEVFKANGESFWGPLMMMNLYSYFTPQARPAFDAMSEEARNSYYGKIVAAELYPASMEGQKVPDFTTTAPDGTKYALNDLLKGKKVLLIDFWASWCAPCKKEIPNLKENYKKYAHKGFEVVSISIDKDEKAWKKALEEHGMPWPNFLDIEVSALYKVKAVPTTYLIDKEGKLIAENLRGEELGQKLAELLGE